MIRRHRRNRFLFLRTVALAAMLLFALAGAAAAQGTDAAVIPDTNVGRWSFLVGSFLPLAIAAVNRQRWTSQQKGASTFAISALAAAGTSYFAGELTAGDLVTSLLIVLVSASITYKTFWHPTGITDAVEEKIRG